MTAIRGVYYHANLSQRHSTLLRIHKRDNEQPVLTIYGEQNDIIAQDLRDEVKFDPRLGQTPRKLNFSNGVTFETTDHTQVSSLEVANASGVLHHVEQFSPHLIGIVAMAFAFAVLIWRYGLDLLVAAAVYATPPIMVEKIDQNTLVFMDYAIATPSQLEQADKDRAIAIYNDILATLPPDTKEHYKFNLQFRNIEDIGPNAMALPGGTMIITDALLNKFEDPNIIASILGHETVHITESHGLKGLYRSLSTYFLITLIAGDTGPLLEDLLLEGQTLLSLSYGRNHETQADMLGLKHTLDAGYDPSGLKLFFQALEGHDNKSWFSSHPSNDERIEAIDNFIKTHVH